MERQWCRLISGMERQWWTDIGLWKDSGRLISGMERQLSTDIGYGKTVVD